MEKSPELNRPEEDQPLVNPVISPETSRGEVKKNAEEAIKKTAEAIRFNDQGN